MADAKVKRVTSRPWTSPTLTRFEPVELTKVSRAVVRRWSVYTPQPPTQQDLDDVWLIVKSKWSRKKSLAQIPITSIRWVPWVVFYPPNNPKQWLGANPEFVAYFGEWVKEQSGFGPRLAATTVRVLLTQYPRDIPTFPTWLGIARSGIRREKTRRLDTLRERQKSLGILNADGPKRIGQQLISGDGQFEKIRSLLGLDDPGAGVGFLRACTEAALAASRSMVAGAKKGNDLQPIVDLVESEPKQLRFPELGSAIAEALLIPWVKVNPEADVREATRIFLVSHLGDPRTVHAPKWHGVSDEAATVMRRWVVGANLEDFFQVIGATAYANQWEFREAFWMAYADREYIDNAWVVFGHDAAREAKSLFDRKQHQYGVLHGAQGDQSVIVMQIGDLTIVEGSHNWTCRIWKTRDRKAPEIGLHSYDKFSLMHGAAFEKRHMGAESGAWQLGLKDYIANHTGRVTSFDDWMKKRRKKKKKLPKLISKKAGKPTLSAKPASPPMKTHETRPGGQKREYLGLSSTFSPGAEDPMVALRRMLSKPLTPEGRIAKCLAGSSPLSGEDIVKTTGLQSGMVYRLLRQNLMVFSEGSGHRWRLRS